MSEHPVDELDQSYFDNCATFAVETLGEHGYAFVDLQPNDGTTYKIVVAQPREWGEVAFKLFTGEPVYGWKKTNRYWVGTSFGPLYPWVAAWHTDWGYVLDHFVHGNSGTAEWTARVIARFLNALAKALKS